MPKNKEENQKEEEKTLKENLQDPTFVNFNTLTKLEEIKKINYAILEILNVFYQKFMQEEEPEEPKEEKEGVFKKGK